VASEISDGFRYSITHTHVTRHVGDNTQTATLIGAEARSLDRFADRANERSEHCEQGGAPSGSCCGPRPRCGGAGVRTACCGRCRRHWPC
jgi:hypothetical protein